MPAAGASGGAQVKSAVRTVELLEYFAGRPAMHSLARLDGVNVVYLATRRSQHYLRPFTRVGRRLPAHSTALGKTLLATHTDEQVRKLLPKTMASLTENTVTDREQLIEDALFDARERLTLATRRL
ncbi:IclR family transcriptional regulator C-terminal domain-containing protein [Streptomyces sp. B-S-A8]|uniref:IclR family transcriptional regulator C-terminal domain-containing protein n=1 Tax=Streptomyces solicavernae TaxID=3043614 RepID=A0ABT6RSK5_9ACTN|nr:IclR family transcriptional regulator C-terminal domain-containing protein [Streptomyces sp. B-S-A8]MDI3387421.1 IclR family transcriptional regulator C-terminal domain-containing protein [Streptomyces sp. B-S-A8]